MGVIQTILYILMVVSSIILILLTLAQSNKGSDLGLFGGSTDMVFGSQKGNILTRITGILATVVIAGTFLMGVIKVHLSRDQNELDKKINKKQIKNLKDLRSSKEEEPKKEEKKTSEEEKKKKNEKSELKAKKPEANNETKKSK